MSAEATAVPDGIFQVFEPILAPPVVSEVRKVLDMTLGRRPDLQGDERDGKWWVNLANLIDSGAPDTARAILSAFCKTPLLAWARERLGQDLVFVLDYCILRRFDPRRRPIPAQWHFDANIFGLTSPMVNFWMPLVDVGETAPGLTLTNAARRPHALWQDMIDLAAEQGGALNAENRRRTLFQDQAVERALANDPSVSLVTPRVRAGGAIAFDQQYLHGTQALTPAMGVRDSLEMRLMPMSVAVTRQLNRRYKVVKAPD